MEQKLFCNNCQLEQPIITSQAGPHTRADCSVCKKYIKFISIKPIQEKVLMFGKHKGKLMIDLVEEDPEYLKWLKNTTASKSFKNEVDAAFTYVEKFLEQTRKNTRNYG